VGFLVVILTLALVAVVVAVIGAPVRRARMRAAADRSGEGDARGGGGSPGSDVPAALESRARDELEAAREAKYREIRDAELDFRTGKLSQEDYQTIDAALRAEAIEILNRLEGAERPTEDPNGSNGLGSV
jgi:hypothetical protein